MPAQVTWQPVEAAHLTVPQYIRRVPLSHRRARRYGWIGAASAVAVVALVGVPLVPGSPLREYTSIGLSGRGAGLAAPTPNWTATAVPSATPAPGATPDGPLLRAAPVTIGTSGFWSWSLLDLKTGTSTGSAPENAISDTASMSKVWVAADWLRRTTEKNQTPSAAALGELSRMIRDSETEHTFRYHVQNGNLASIHRMVKLCGLTDTRGVPNSWSLTKMSSRDVTRLGACIADQRAAGPRWTGWLLNEMRNVRSTGRFGIIEALPAAVAPGTAIKNGWLLRDDKQWHIACLAIGDGWVLGVMARYPETLGKDHGSRICRDVTRQLLPPV